jgi:DNA-directed RNA polymerase specialized sigma24 family protein
MRTRAEVERVLELAGAGLGATEIAHRTDIPRGTVRGWLRGAIPRGAAEPTRLVVPEPAYSELLGL